ncbi:DUF4340 domain-containing protein [Caldicellulosiruptoraceae bacterium PP1]
MKKTYRLIAAFAVLLVLVGAYIYVLKHPKKEATNKTQPSNSVQILKKNKDDIVKVTLDADGTVLTLYKQNGKWLANNIKNPDFLNQDKIDDIVFTFSSLFAENVVESNPKDLSKYGLQTPFVIGQATYKDGSKVTLLLGDKTAVGNTFYLMKDGDKRVFTVWQNIGDNLMTKLNSLFTVSLPELTSDEIQYIKIVKKGEKTLELVREDDTKAKDKPYDIGSIWFLAQPYSEKRAASSQDLSSVIESIANITPEEVVEATYDFKKYGLDNPVAELIVKDKEKTLDIMIGNAKDSDYTYLKQRNSNIIYTISNSNIDFLRTTTPFKVADKFAFIANIDYVKKIEISHGNKTHVITQDRKLVKKAKSADEQDEYQSTFKVDGKKIDEDLFRKFYQILVGILVDGENDKKPSGEADYTLKYYFSNGNTDIVKFIPYNDDFYIVDKNGHTDFVSSKEQMVRMYQDLENLIVGKFKPLD